MQSKAALEGILRTSYLWLMDIVSVVQILMIFMTVFHVPSFFKRAYNILQERKNPGVAGTICPFAFRALLTLQIESDSLTSKDYKDAHQIMKDEEEANFPLSMTFFKVIIFHELVDGFRHAPHFLLLPLKVVWKAHLNML